MGAEMAVFGVYVLVALSVFAVNLVPAFGPPTWAVLVLWYLGEDLSEAALVALGAVAAASGRLVLGWATGRLRGHLPARYRENLLAAGRRLLSHRRGTWAGLVAFALSPLPSAQLFEAAGLLCLRLAPLTAAFFVGRAVSYSIYLGTARIVRRTDAGQALTSSLTSPWAALLQVVMLAGLVVLARVNWSPLPHRYEEGPEPPPQVPLTDVSGPSALGRGARVAEPGGTETTGGNDVHDP